MPERLNDIEIYAYQGFLKVLQFCDQKHGITNENDFTTCIKAGGVNFRESLSQWEAFKYSIFHRKQQGIVHKWLIKMMI